MPVNQIQLTDTERGLLDRIEFNPLARSHDATAARKSGEAAYQLTLSLLKRQAVPKIRWAYFTDPMLNIGRVKCSRKEVFERNGTTGDAIFRHPHFLKCLWYFLHGPTLPADIIEGFCTKISECQPVTSGDLPTLRSCATRQTRSHGLDRRKAAKEFYKLALECDLAEFEARAIRDAVMAVR